MFQFGSDVLYQPICFRHGAEEGDTEASLELSGDEAARHAWRRHASSHAFESHGAHAGKAAHLQEAARNAWRHASRRAAQKASGHLGTRQLRHVRQLLRACPGRRASAAFERCTGEEAAAECQIGKAAGCALGFVSGGDGWLRVALAGTGVVPCGLPLVVSFDEVGRCGQRCLQGRAARKVS